ncbi:MAG: hypothetical protein ACYDC3_11060 [Candidatus Binataceae bacterium]
MPESMTEQHRYAAAEINEVAPGATGHASRMALAVIALFVAMFACRLPLTMLARQHLYFLIDELELTETAADHFLGVPQFSLAWPGTVNDFLVEPFFAADYVIQVRGDVSPSSFVDYLSKFYRSPWRMFLVARLFLTAIAALGLAIILPNLSRQTGSVALSAAGLLLIATVPELMFQSSGAFAAGPALGFVCVSIAIALTPRGAGRFEPYVTLCAGVFFGAALAGRNLMLPVIPLVAALLAKRSAHPARTVVIFCIISGAAFIALCPQTWLDPIRWAKSNLGNYRMHGRPAGLLRSALSLIEAIQPWLFVAFAAAMAMLIRKREWTLGIGGGLATAFMLLAAAGSPLAQKRYFEAMIIVAGTVACLGLIAPSAAALRRIPNRTTRAIVAAAPVVFILFYNLAATHTQFDNAFSTRAETVFANAAEAQTLRATVKTYGRRALLAPLELWPWVADLASVKSLAATADAARAALRSGHSVSAYTASFGLNPADTEALANDFNEKEQDFAARFAIMAAGYDHGDVNVTFYARPEIARRFGLLTEEEAAQGLSSGRFDAEIVSPSTAPVGANLRAITPTIGLATRDAPAR